MTAPTAPPAGRPYIILEQDLDDKTMWKFLKIVQASTVEQAMKIAAEEEVKRVDWHSGTLVAVPERSWAPKQITVATKTTVSFA